MSRNQQRTFAGGAMTLFIVFLNGIVLEQGITQDKSWYTMLLVTIPLLLMSIIGSQRKAS